MCLIPQLLQAVLSPCKMRFDQTLRYLLVLISYNSTKTVIVSRITKIPTLKPDAVALISNVKILVLLGLTPNTSHLFLPLLGSPGLWLFHHKSLSYQSLIPKRNAKSESTKQSKEVISEDKSKTEAIWMNIQVNFLTKISFCRYHLF